MRPAIIGAVPKERIAVLSPGIYSRGAIVAVSKADKAREYANYAEHCLKIVKTIPDQKSRAIHREMAAEWLKLADAIRRPSRRQQTQMQ